MRQFEDGHVLTRADIDVLVAGVVIHEKHARISKIIDMQELAARAAGAPYDDGIDTIDPRVVKLADHRRQHVTRLEVEVVVGPIEVGGHRRDEVAAVLVGVCLTELDARDLRDRVGLVGRFELSVEQLVFTDGLVREARVDARAAEVQQLAHAGEIRRVHHSGVNHHVVVEELCGIGRVGEDATDFARNEEHVLGAVLLEPALTAA
jgi:hypothetical protein